MPEGKVLAGDEAGDEAEDEAAAGDCSGGAKSADAPLASAFCRPRKNRRILPGKRRVVLSLSVEL